MNNKGLNISDLQKSMVLDKMPASVIVVNKELEIVYVNEALKLYMEIDNPSIIGMDYLDLFDEVYEEETPAIKKAIIRNEPVKENIVIFKNNVMKDVEVYAVPYYDDDGLVIGGIEILFDISEDMARWKQLIHQSKTIQEMSTPTIKLWDDILLLPVVGVIDSERAQKMMESILNRIADAYAKVIILDIKGVAAVDTAVANHLIKITIATSLMGCECILSGISPSVAHAIIQLGITMENVNTKANLSDALAEAFYILNKKVIDLDGTN